ncbi:unnamed protein product [Parnassius apollo]|uniref:(apollo) hypothetical protein n=1 Tax=Parnassius apollo TaxID=110799 RepID=A0A8S3WXP1_PARAO|nr:unnamed protein product [Parnassius apollo]
MMRARLQALENQTTISSARSRQSPERRDSRGSPRRGRCSPPPLPTARRQADAPEWSHANVSERRRESSCSTHVTTQLLERSAQTLRSHTPPLPTMTSESAAKFRAGPSVETSMQPPVAASEVSVTDRIVDAICSISNRVRSDQNYFISCFDPSLHNISDWCEEVDRAKLSNNWSDHECLARIGNCLKGDARLWLREWVTSDRTWSNFKKEFTPLCPKTPDIANILYEVMSTNSDNYSTYADYARRSLLRLSVVRGLSDELISAIVIRGITDPHIKASATNAKLLPQDLVGFLSIYVKHSTSRTRPQSTLHNNSKNNKNNSSPSTQNRKRKLEEGKCFSCGLRGHKQAFLQENKNRFK